MSGSVYRSLRSGKLRGFWRRDLLGEMPQGMCADDGIGRAGLRRPDRPDVGEGRRGGRGHEGRQGRAQPRLAGRAPTAGSRLCARESTPMTHELNSEQRLQLIAWIVRCS